MVDCLSLHCIRQATDTAIACALSDDRRSGLSASSGSIDHDLAHFLVAALTRFHNRFTCRHHDAAYERGGVARGGPTAFRSITRWCDGYVIEIVGMLLIPRRDARTRG
jgi:hypothetical protein